MDAYHDCWVIYEPGKAMHSDGKGSLNNDAAKEVLKSKGTELRTRAHRQRATTIEARTGTLRATTHMMEADLEGHDMPLNRLPAMLSHSTTARPLIRPCLAANRRASQARQQRATQRPLRCQIRTANRKYGR